MGKLRKKLTLGLLEKISSFASIILSFAFAGFLGYNAYFKEQSKNVLTLFKIGFYFFMILGIVFTLAFIVSCILSLNIKLYEEGIYFVSDREMLLYSDMPTFYFIPFDYLVVETKYETKLLFKRKKVGEDFFFHFQKDYVNSVLDENIKKIKDGEKISFGVMEDKDIKYIKKFKFGFLIKNFKFKNSIEIDSNHLYFDEKVYDMADIDLKFDVKKNSVKINSKSGENIIEKNIYYIEKAELLPELVEKIRELAVEERRQNSTEDIKNQEYTIPDQN